jgi:hypothetical protein
MTVPRILHTSQSSSLDWCKFERCLGSCAMSFRGADVLLIALVDLMRTGFGSTAAEISSSVVSTSITPSTALEICFRTRFIFRRVDSLLVSLLSCLCFGLSLLAVQSSLLSGQVSPFAILRVPVLPRRCSLRTRQLFGFFDLLLLQETGRFPFRLLARKSI